MKFLIKKKYSLPKEPKILMIFSYDFMGPYTRDLAMGFANQGKTFALISLSGFTYSNWPTEFGIKNLSKDFNKIMNPFQKLIKTVRVCREFNPDIIQTHLFYGGIIGVICGLLLKKPVILTRHHLDEHFLTGQKIHRILDHLSAKFATVVVTFSKATKDWIVENEGINSEKIKIINQGFSFDGMSPSKKEILKAKQDLHFESRYFNIICVARYSKTKGQEYLLEAFKRLLLISAADMTLTFIGPGDSHWLEDLASRDMLGEKVRILKSRDNIPACIAAADLVVHPSLVDSFSQLIIEAQAVGCPLIAFDIAAAREQILDGFTGVIIPPRDVDMLVTSIERLYRNKIERIKMGLEGKTHVRNVFPLVKMVEKEISLINQICSEK